MTEDAPRAKSIANQCRYYTGIANGTCRAGIVYREVRASDSHPYRWPCFQDDGCSERCASVSYYTAEEIGAQLKESKAALERWAGKLRNNICPECNQPIQYKRQVGRCVYACPCNHRLYQGRLSEEERAKQPKPMMPTLRTFWQMPSEQQRQLVEQLALVSSDPWEWEEEG
jgi:hypothetical protein